MGDGVGAKDVSDQIEDEDQLRGKVYIVFHSRILHGKFSPIQIFSSVLSLQEEEEKEQDTPDNVLDKNKGIEMTDKFKGKEYSLSEDSEEDKEDEESEDEQLDSKLGDAGSDAEKADEKPWGKDEDEEAGNKNEKNESGPSVADKDTSSRELRAKDDDGADTADEPEESNTSDKPEEGNDENVDQDNFGEPENLEDEIKNQNEALTDTSGPTPELDNEQTDDAMQIDKTDEVEKEDEQEEPCPEDQKHPEEGENDEESQEPAEETTEAGAEDVSESPQKDPGNDLEQKCETEPIEGKEVVMSEDMKPNVCNDNISGVDAGSHNPHRFNGLGAGSTAPQENLAATNVSDELTDSMDPPSGSNTEMNLTMASGETLTDNIPKIEVPQSQSTSQQTKVNPYRNVGDALKEWKERIKVSSDLGEKQEAENEMEDPDAGEYGFASQFDEGTSQALGPALPEQVNTDMREGESEDEKLAGNQDEASPMDIDDANPENTPAVQSKPSIMNSTAEPVQEPDTDRTLQENSPIQNVGDGNSRMDSMVSVDNTFLGEDACSPDWMQVADKDTESNHDNEEDPDARSNAVILWRRCELLTTKPSQELAEQLRLILEPTLASKLSGDYRTGKRINMKKVIPYIASHYRKDKIWLRRTKPNKRDYQVVIAVDDSRSMSESGCGDFAIRALATVCRAMSQLEMGSLAVSSFGKK